VTRALLGLVVLGSASCATLNTAGMSETCRNLYNACLNACPNPSTRAPPGPTITTISPQADVAGCVNDCNERAKKCE
jgi:hypothetical protein